MKSAKLSHLVREDKEYRKVIENFSEIELSLIIKNKDLGDRLKEISKMKLKQVLDSIRADFKLKIHPYGDAENWISLHELGFFKDLPKWWRTTHNGWNIRTEDMVKFGQGLLIQEVRINLYLRYIEDTANHKKNSNLVGTGGQYL